MPLTAGVEAVNAACGAPRSDLSGPKTVGRPEVVGGPKRADGIVGVGALAAGPLELGPGALPAAPLAAGMVLLTGAVVELAAAPPWSGLTKAPGAAALIDRPERVESGPAALWDAAGPGL
jgi:hypothetical protein